MVETIMVIAMITFNVGLYSWFNKISREEIAVVMKK